MSLSEYRPTRMVSLPVGSIRAIGLKTSEGRADLKSWCAVNRIEGSFALLLVFEAWVRVPSAWPGEVLLAIADRVLAMAGAIFESRGTEALLPASKAEEESDGVDCGCMPVRAAPFWPATVGSQPLVPVL